jgi:hypothetical protein
MKYKLKRTKCLQEYTFKGHIYFDPNSGEITAHDPNGNHLRWLRYSNGELADDIPSSFGFELDSQGRITGSDLEELKAFAEKNKRNIV